MNCLYCVEYFSQMASSSGIILSSKYPCMELKCIYNNRNRQQRYWEQIVRMVRNFSESLKVVHREARMCVGNGKTSLPPLPIFGVLVNYCRATFLIHYSSSLTIAAMSVVYKIAKSWQNRHGNRSMNRRWWTYDSSVSLQDSKGAKNFRTIFFYSFQSFTFPCSLAA